MDRRQFLNSIALPLAAVPVAAAFKPGIAAELLPVIRSFRGTPAEMASNEELWFRVQQAFTVDRSLINLNNGGVSPSPAVVQDAMKRHLDYSNLAPVYTMWGVLEPQRETVRQSIARMQGVDAEEIALTRNASESLQILQLGFDLKPGDEVLTTTQDYPRMITTFRQRARREGIVLRQFDIPTPAEDDDLIVSLFERNITPKTKLILVSHMIFMNGNILPVKRVTELGRRRGIPVVVDGAHAFSHAPGTIAELDVDYYASSLHKWLMAPHGTGLLYVKKDKISEVWPMMAAPDNMDADIRKFEEIGTHPAANYLAIAEAITFTEGIGQDVKTARLIWLRDRWANELAKFDRVTMRTSLKPGRAAGLATVDVEGVEPIDIVNHLWKKHRMIVVAINEPFTKGIRVAPNVYTTPGEIDRFVEAMTDVIKNGIKA
jgi:isopenicillin-N epimerase